MFVSVFTEDQEDVNDGVGSGHPSRSTAYGNIEAVKKKFLSVSILVDQCPGVYGIKCVVAKFIPNLLHFGQKNRRKNIAQEMSSAIQICLNARKFGQMWRFCFFPSAWWVASSRQKVVQSIHDTLNLVWTLCEVIRRKYPDLVTKLLIAVASRFLVLFKHRSLFVILWPKQNRNRASVTWYYNFFLLQNWKHLEKQILATDK